VKKYDSQDKRTNNKNDRNIKHTSNDKFADLQSKSKVFVCDSRSREMPLLRVKKSQTGQSRSQVECLQQLQANQRKKVDDEK
jgi:hypothetical protein